MWIQEYREREGLELYQFQRLVNVYNHMTDNPLPATISAKLIHILECDSNAVTHPVIADILAAVCHATPEQRDMIIAKERRLRVAPWTLTPETELLVAKANLKYRAIERKEEKLKRNADREQQMQMYQQQAKPIKLKPGTKHSVVKVNYKGDVVEQYDTIVEAANKNYHTPKYVRLRCLHKIKCEFGLYLTLDKKLKKREYTYRYTNEWLDMTPEQRADDLNGTLDKAEGEGK